MNEVYIVLIRAHTGLGGVARLVTRYEYTHASVSFDRSLTDFVSYSRRYHSFPFDAGFTHEYRDYYAFGRHRDVKVRVFRLCPDDVHMSAVRSLICRCESDGEELFNVFSMLTMPVLHGLPIWKAHNCMSFAARVAELTGCAELDKPFDRYSLPELDELLTEHLYFEGLLPRRHSAGYQSYMRTFAPVKYLSDLLKLTGQLTYRLLWKQSGRNGDSFD